MRTIIAGSRGVRDGGNLQDAIDQCGWEVTEVISGGARGVDEMGEIYAFRKGIPLIVCPANWGFHGKKAGVLRNIFMSTLAEALIAIWDGESGGTRHMIKVAKEKNLKVYVYKTI